MFHVHSFARTRARLALAAVVALGLLASGCVKPLPDQSDAKLTITATQLTGNYSPGDDVKVRVTVTNSGTRDVSLLAIQSTLAPGLLERSLSCSPLGASAAFPGDATCADFIYMKTLAKGASVTLDFDATVASTATGTLTSSFNASLNSGPTVTASNQATVVDTRSGAYVAFTSDGRHVPVAADFAANTLTFADSDGSVVSTFTTQALDPSYLFGTNAGFLAQHDLLAGTVPFGGGTPAFFAARKFLNTVDALDGLVFNAFGVDTPAGGLPASRFESIAINGSTMQLCAAAAPQPATSCPAASLHSYALSVVDGVFTAADATDNDTLTFQVAQSDSALVFLRAEPTATGHAFRVGLSANATITSAQLDGGDTSGRWGDALISASSLEESFTQVSAPLAALAAPVPGGPAGLLASNLASGTPAWLAEDNGLAIVLAQPGSSQDGLLQVFAR